MGFLGRGTSQLRRTGGLLALALFAVGGGLLVAAGPVGADPAVTVAASSPVTEGNTGTTTLSFTITLPAPASGPVVVSYSTSDGTATTADADYVAITSGTVTVPDTQTQATVSVTVFETSPGANVSVPDVVV
jgi:hypothetical protein